MSLNAQKKLEDLLKVAFRVQISFRLFLFHYGFLYLTIYNNNYYIYYLYLVIDLFIKFITILKIFFIEN